MADSLISGAQALVLAVIDILKNYWAAELTTICTDLGITLSAPNATHGYSASRLLPRNAAHRCGRAEAHNNHAEGADSMGPHHPDQCRT